MPCGRARRNQFSSQADYESHHTRMMRTILGPDWQDKPLQQLIAEHPELQRPTLLQLLTLCGERQELELEAVWQAAPTDESEPPTQQVNAPLAIESGGGY